MQKDQFIQQTVDLLSSLVACPSVNPNRRIPETEPFGEAGIAHLLEKELISMGAEVQIQEVLPRRPNVIGLFRGKGNAPSLMLEAHSDTVSIEGMTIPPLEARFDGQKIWGRGSCDTKGSMAAMLMAIRLVLVKFGKPPGDIYFVSTIDEELSATGAHALMESGFRVDRAIVGEPTLLSLVYAHKGALRWRIRTSGKSGHSSQPRQGINAIYKMAPIVSLIENKIAAQLADIIHPLLGHATISIGTIHGGNAVNIIPNSCVIEVDRRVLPGEDRDQLTTQLRSEINELHASGKVDEFGIEETDWYPPFEISPDATLLNDLAQASMVCGIPPTVETAPWASNAGVFHTAGISCILFGPGSIEQAHKEVEFIDIVQVLRAAKVLATFIMEGQPVGIDLP